MVDSPFMRFLRVWFYMGGFFCSIAWGVVGIQYAQQLGLWKLPPVEELRADCRAELKVCMDYAEVGRRALH